MYWTSIMSFMFMYILFLLMVIFFFLQMKMFKAMNFKYTFECGFNMKKKVHNIFSINYFYMTIIFLIFDLEILIILPLIMFKISTIIMMYLLLFVSYFMLILLMEWSNLMLEWQN